MICPQFLQLFHHHDHGFAQLVPQQRHAHKFRVFIAVADNQRVAWLCMARPANNSGLLPTSRPKL